MYASLEIHSAHFTSPDNTITTDLCGDVKTTGWGYPVEGRTCSSHVMSGIHFYIEKANLSAALQVLVLLNLAIQIIILLKSLRSTNSFCYCPPGKYFIYSLD